MQRKVGERLKEFCKIYLEMKEREKNRKQRFQLGLNLGEGTRKRTLIWWPLSCYSRQLVGITFSLSILWFPSSYWFKNELVFDQRTDGGLFDAKLAPC